MILRLIFIPTTIGIAQMFAVLPSMPPGVIVLFLLLYTFFAFFEPLWGVIGVVVAFVMANTGIYEPEFMVLQVHTFVILLWFAIVFWFFSVTS